MKMSLTVRASVGVLLVVSVVTLMPTRLRAGFCEEPWIGLDRMDWTGQCAPETVDACFYFIGQCEYYCFTQYAGNLCSDSGLHFCQEYATGGIDSPTVWCLSEGYCDCTYEL
jgi:hypothetical protein